MEVNDFFEGLVGVGVESEKICMAMKQAYLGDELKNSEDIKNAKITSLVPSVLCQQCPRIKIEPGNHYSDGVGIYWKLICGSNNNEGRAYLQNAISDLIKKGVSL